MPRFPTKKFLIVANMSLALGACSSAQFSGQSGGKAQTNPVVTPAVTSLSCSLSPASIKVGEKAVIAVKANEGFSGSIEQKIQKADGSAVSSTQLNADGSRVDGAANEYAATEVGSFKIELRKDSASAVADGSCELAVLAVDTPVPVASTTPEVPKCTEKQRSIGAQVAFLIDNSNSNSATDCTSPKKIGNFNNADTFECQGPTNREKAVLAAFETLRTISDAEAGNAAAMSRIAVAAFPTTANYQTGWEVKSGGWIDSNTAGQNKVAGAMLFTRRPFGLTPYDAAMAGGLELFKDVTADGRGKVAVLVTDGEPTDRDAVVVVEKAEQLRAQGVKVYTVFITSGQSRTTRQAEHVSMLRGFDDTSKSTKRGPWYAQRYANFDAYTADLLGLGGGLSLVEKVTSKTDSNCQDKAGGKCERNIVEVDNSAALSNVFKQIVATEVKCE